MMEVLKSFCGSLLQENTSASSCGQQSQQRQSQQEKQHAAEHRLTKLAMKDKQGREFPPETLFDDLPSESLSELSPRQLFSVEMLEESLGEGAKGKQECGRQSLLENLKKDEFIVLRLSEEDLLILKHMYEEMDIFFRQPDSEKEKVAGLFMDQWRHGWEKIHFSNEENKRFPESRDVFSFAPCFFDLLKFPSESFKLAASNVLALYQRLSFVVLSAIAAEIGCVPSVFFDLLQESPEVQKSSLANHGVSSTDSRRSNLSFFRYQDDAKVLPCPQKCMVHQDSGLITLLARATIPGLEILSADRSKFTRVEERLEERDMLVYFGKTMQRITCGLVPAAYHRVIRSPHSERYSMPFEVKAASSATLAPLFSSPAVKLQFDLTPRDEDPVGAVQVHCAICDGCRKYLCEEKNGGRYKCQQCHDFDLCGSCFEKERSGEGTLKSQPHGKKGHTYKKLEKPQWMFEDYATPIPAHEFYRELQCLRSAIRMWRWEAIYKFSNEIDFS